MEGDGSAPRVFRADRDNTEAVVLVRKRVGDARSKLAVGEQGLRVAGREQFELPVGREHRKRVERSTVRPQGAERERPIELVASRVRAALAGQEPVRVLARGPQILRQLCDRQTLCAEKCLPNIGILGHWLRV
jgi:hypothetical protein